MEGSMRLLFEAAALVFLFSVFSLVLVRWMENRMMFAPSAEHELYPERFGLEPEEVWIAAGEDGDKIHGWYFNSSPGNVVILYAHGNGGNIADRLPVIKGYVESGYDLFIYDYRGFGKSGGSPGRKRFIEDNFAAYDYLTKTRSVDPSEIVLLGQSLGGAVVLRLANEIKCRAVILEGTFFSIKQIARDLYPYIPVWIAASSDLDNGREVKKLGCPLLLIHGTDDTTLPHYHSEMLYEAARDPKEFLSIKGAGHTDLYAVNPSRYYGAISRFIESSSPDAGKIDPR
jgi:hypothetical protein